jgi:hypothetical protein
VLLYISVLQYIVAKVRKGDKVTIKSLNTVYVIKRETGNEDLNCVQKLYHNTCNHFNGLGYCTYWQEKEVNFLMFLDAGC